MEVTMDGKAYINGFSVVEDRDWSEIIPKDTMGISAAVFKETIKVNPLI